MLSDDMPCPCGSGLPYGSCCLPCHRSEPAAGSPVALMRSRYSAYTLGLTDYLLNTWHTSTRPAELDLSNTPRWASLLILDKDQTDTKGTVHFRAIYRQGKDWGYLEEKSDFLREDGRWFYLAGETREGRLKPGRNDHCPCGSGRKHKVCCY